MKMSLLMQIGGNHYKGMKIEPFTFALVNNYDAASFSILKYVSRHRAKNGLEDLKKAAHICYIRAEELPQDFRVSARDKIPVEMFIQENGIPDREAAILRDVHLWARQELTALTDREAADWIAQKIAALAEHSYGKENT